MASRFFFMIGFGLLCLAWPSLAEHNFQRHGPCVVTRFSPHWGESLPLSTPGLTLGSSSDYYRNVQLEAFHIRHDPDGRIYEVLVPAGADSWKVVRTTTHEDAVKIAQTKIPRPIDFGPELKAAPLVLERIKSELKPIQEKFQAEIIARVKDSKSLKNKVFIRSKHPELNVDEEFNLSHIRDLAGARFVVDDWAQVNQIAKEISKKLQQIHYSNDVTRNFNPKGGYQAIHLAGVATEGTRFEIQVMTRRMKLWHEWDHAHVYKPSQALEPNYEKRLKQYSKEMANYIYSRDMNKNVPLPNPIGIRKEDLFPLDRLQGIERALTNKSKLERKGVSILQKQLESFLVARMQAA